MGTLRAEITDTAIDLAEALQEVGGAAHGAVASFVGQVRDHDPEVPGEVAALDYSCHPDAPAMIGKVVAGALAVADPHGEASVVALHRVGHLEVGDLALVVTVGSAHRSLAFEVCRAVVEAVKHELPVWKKQYGTDGAHVWSGLSSCGS